MGIMVNAANLLKSKISDLFPDTPPEPHFPAKMLPKAQSGQSRPIQNTPLEPTTPKTPPIPT
jgi:hypothetical protein